MAKKPSNKQAAAKASDASNVCMVCNKHFTSIYEMRVHQAEHTAGPLKLSSSEISKVPLVTSNTPPKKKNPSKVSKTRTPSTSILSPVSSPDGRKFSCDLCRKKYKRIAQLQHHMSSFHSQSKAYTCKVCGLGLGDERAYKLHISTHSTDLPFKCDICGEEFQYSAYLSSHRVIHTGENPFSCDYCGQIFSENASLKYHVMITHAGETLHQCSACGAKFTNSAEFEKHKNKCMPGQSSDTEDSGLNLSTEEEDENPYVPVKKKDKKKQKIMSPKKKPKAKKGTSPKAEKKDNKKMTREERQLEAALRAIEKMEQREARRAAELKSNMALNESVQLSISPPREKSTATSKTKAVTKTKENKSASINHSKSATTTAKKQQKPKPTKAKVTTNTAKPTNDPVLPLTREERQMQAALRAIEKMEKRVPTKRTSVEKSPSPSPPATPTSSEDTAPFPTTAKKTAKRPTAAAGRKRKANLAPAASVSERDLGRISKKSLKNPSVTEPASKGAGKKGTKRTGNKKSNDAPLPTKRARNVMSSEERQMAEALRAIERMEKREQRRKAELDWSNSLIAEQGDDSDTEAASSDATMMNGNLERKKKLTKRVKKQKNTDDKSEVEAKRAKLEKKEKKNQKKLDKKKKTAPLTVSTKTSKAAYSKAKPSVSSATVYQGSASSPWQQVSPTSTTSTVEAVDSHRPIPAPGGAGDTDAVIMSREERQMAEALKAIARMEARQSRMSKDKREASVEPKVEPEKKKLVKKSAATNSKAVASGKLNKKRSLTPDMPLAKVELEDIKHTIPPINTVRPEKASRKQPKEKVVRKIPKRPADDEFSTSEEEMDESPKHMPANSRGIWSIKETALSGKEPTVTGSGNAKGGDSGAGGRGNHTAKQHTTPSTKPHFSTQHQPSGNTGGGGAKNSRQYGGSGVGMVQQTPYSRPPPSPPKMSREERKMAAIMAQFAKMS